MSDVENTEIVVDDMPDDVRMAVKKLKPRQGLFCEYLVIHEDQSKAYMEAGYKTKNSKVAAQAASRLLSTNVNIQIYLSWLRIQKVIRLREEGKLTTDYLINTLIDTVERCRQVRPVYDRSGEPALTETPDGGLAPVYAFQPLAVLKGIELLGRHLGIFNDKLVVVPGTMPKSQEEIDKELKDYEESEG